MAGVVLLLAALALPPAERVLIIHTPSGDITARQAGLFEAHLRLELEKRVGLAVVQRVPGEAATDDATCVEKPTCLAQLAKGLGADVVVFARSARIAGDSVVTMKRLRILTGEIEQTTTRSFTGGDGQEMLAAIGSMCAELFPERSTVDGALIGVANADVVRWTPPPVQPWMFWTGVGATAAGVAAVAVFSIQKSNAENDFRDLTAQSVVSGIELRDAMDRANSARTHANIAIGATLGLGVTTAILGYFTDWHRDRDTELLIGPTGAAMQTTF